MLRSLYTSLHFSRFACYLSANSMTRIYWCAKMRAWVSELGNLRQDHLVEELLSFLYIIFHGWFTKKSLDVTIATISFPNGKLGQGAALGWGICLWCKGDTFHNVFCWKVYTSAGPTLGNTGKWFFSNICLYWNHSSSLLPLPRGVIL